MRESKGNVEIYDVEERTMVGVAMAGILRFPFSFSFKKSAAHPK